MNVIYQLVGIYLTQEDWHRWKLSVHEAVRYYTYMFNNGNIIYQADNNGNVIGYIEFYKIDYDQFKKIADKKDFHIEDENIKDGPICFVSDLWISPGHRRNSVYKLLKNRLFEATHSCDYYAGYEVGHNRRLQIRRNHYGKRKIYQ